jgi:rod shape-determining protein MreC
LLISSNVSSVVLFPLRTVFSYVKYLSISEQRIHDLETQIQTLRLQNVELRKQVTKDSLELTTMPYELMKTHIIGRDPTNINGYLYIDKGSDHGIKIDQPVLTTDGLVGKVHFVAHNYSIVETIEHEGFAVSAIDIRTGIHGIVRKNNSLLFDFIRVDDSIHINDSICTSGMSEIFPEGLLIGQVKGTGEPHDPFFKPIYLRPAVKVNRLTYTYVLSGYSTNTIDLNIKQSETRP